MTAAKRLIFMTLEDETGKANIIVMPDFYEKNRAVVSYESGLDCEQECKA